MVEVQYIDKHGLHDIWPASDRTVYRQQERKTDPFPAAQLIGGKRYWKRGEVLKWLARQNNPISKNMRAANAVRHPAAGQLDPETDAEAAPVKREPESALVKA